MKTWQATKALNKLAGELRVPSDKSITHRAVILAGLAKGTSLITDPLLAEDTKASIKAMEAFGATASIAGNKLTLAGCAGNLVSPSENIDCGNSGTLIRLIAGAICGRNVSCVLTGDESLTSRPMGRISDPLNEMGAKINTTNGMPPLQVAAVDNLKRIEYTLPKASAQIKSAVMLAGLSATEGCAVIEPLPCRDHTERILPSFGASVTRVDKTIEVGFCQQLTATDIQVPADVSSAAFFLVAASIVPNSEVILTDVGINITRDGVIKLLIKMGANITMQNKRKMGNEEVADLVVKHADLHGIEITGDDVPGCIDEIPVLMVAASLASGTTTISGAAELRVKESDRIAAMVKALTAIGADITEKEDGAVINGGQLPGKAVVDSFGDHRIAMAMAVAALCSNEAIEIQNCENVQTSFPNFEDTAATIGWKLEVKN